MKRRHWVMMMAAATALAVKSYAEDAQKIDAGKAAYGLYCARCHGDQGKGDGMDAKRVPVKPRDLTSGVFKFRSTASGTPPSDADLMWVLNHGLSGSGMPSFANLEKDAKESLIAYIKTLSAVFGQYQPQPLPPPNEKIKFNPKRGAEVYALLQCAKCHGDAGRANGPSAPTLTDTWGDPIKAANLEQGWTYRAGSSAKDVYYRLMAGLNGTPMPSYDGAVSSEDAWQLANYVVSLQWQAKWNYKIPALRVSADVPSDLNDPAWKKAPAGYINLQESVYEQGARLPTKVNAVQAQVIYNNQAMAVRLSWHDPVANTKVPLDAMLVAMEPNDFKGDTRATLHTFYTPASPALDLMYWQASEPEVVHQKVSNIETALRSNWASARALKAKAAYNDGLWTLVFIRPFNSDPANVINPQENELLVGFAAWDGEMGKGDLRRSASQWIRLTLRESLAHH